MTYQIIILIIAALLCSTAAPAPQEVTLKRVRKFQAEQGNVDR
jgi:hypothetical protein